MKKLILTATMILVTTAFLTMHSEARELEVRPGQWNFKVVVDLSESNTPLVQTRTRCFKESEMDPFETFNVNHEKTGCDINNLKGDSGETLEWRWFCEGNEFNPKTNGKGKYVSTGDEINGYLKTTYFENGQLISTNVNIEGEYVGDCASSDDKVLLTRNDS